MYENVPQLFIHYFSSGQLHSMNRPRQEVISNTLKRLLSTIKKKLTLKSPKKSKTNPGKPNKNKCTNDGKNKYDNDEKNIDNNNSSNNENNDRNGAIDNENGSDEIILKYPNNRIVQMNTLRNDEIVSGMFFTFDQRTFEFIKNPPTTTSLQLYPKSCVMVGYPIVPTITTDYADGYGCLWYCETNSKEVVLVSEGEIYTPGEETVGCKLKMFCTAWRWDDIDNNESKTGCDDINGDNSSSNESSSSSSSSSSRSSSSSNNSNNNNNNNNNKDNSGGKRVKVTGRAAVCYVSGAVQPSASDSRMLEVRRAFNGLRIEGEEREGEGRGEGGGEDKEGGGVDEEEGVATKGKRAKTEVACNDSNRDSSNNGINDSNGTGDDTGDDGNFYSPNSNNTYNVDFLNFNNLSLDEKKSKKSKGDVRCPCVRQIDELRVVTFNILAEPFAISDHAVHNIYAYCPVEYLETEYRVQLVLQELIAYRADIICLQECDSKTFKYYLQPLMRSHGYESHYTNKVSNQKMEFP